MTPNIVQEIKDRIKLSEIVSRKVKLIKKGREYNGLCPFHNDSSPSLWVNDEKGTYHCFSCQAGGDIFAFIMNSENLAYFEVLKKLANEIGLKLPEKSDFGNKDKFSRLYDILNIACEFFQKNLQHNKTAIEYFSNRDINNDIISEFNLGYAPAGNVLVKYLVGKNYTNDEIMEAGLALRSQYNTLYDRFQNRVIFPIFDTKNRVIAFGGRVLDNSKPKYLNSPETKLFNKSNILFAENKLIAKKDSGNIIIVEGYIDAISLYKVGIDNIVAPLGTSLTEAHVKKLWRYDSRPILCFDGDEAGVKAAERIVSLILPIISAEFNLQFCILPNNSDPDDIIKNYGKEEFLNILSKKISIIDLLWDGTLKKYLPLTPENKTLLEKDLEKQINMIHDKKLSYNYLRYIKDKLWQYSRILAKSNFFGNINNNLNLAIKGLSKTQKIELDILILIASHPELINDDEISLELHNLEFINTETENLLINILKLIDLFTIESKLDITLKEYIQKEIIDKNSLINDYIKQNNNLINKILLLNNNSSNLKKLWFLSYYQYLFLRMERERNSALGELTEKSREKADYLYKQMSEINYKIKKIQEEINNLTI